MATRDAARYPTRASQVSRRATDRKYRASPKGQYAKHKENARRRGVDFLLSFDEWWSLWEKSGHYRQRGNRNGRYVMSRMNDVGPYAVGNVFIATFSSNVCDRNRSVVVKKHTAKTTTVTFEDECPF